jgi:hypothetical protein
MSDPESGECPRPPDDNGIESAAPTRSRWDVACERWRRAHEWLARAMEPTHGALPFDLIDIFVAGVMNAVARVLRMAAAPAAGTALGIWAVAFDAVDSWDPRTWPTPLDLVYRDGVWDFSELAGLPLAGLLTWAFSFIACFQVSWLFPLWMATILTQCWWCISALADSETRWLAPVTVIAAAAQVYAGAIDAEPNRFGIAFLAITGMALVALRWVRLWMFAHDLTPWDFFDADKGGFDPSFHRWRRRGGNPNRSTNTPSKPPKSDGATRHPPPG